MESEKQQTIKSDDDLASALSPQAGELYTAAKEHAETLPDYSLMKLRKLAEAACTRFIAHFDIPISNDVRDFFERIDALEEYLSKQSIDALHTIRKFGNTAVHDSSSSSDPRRASAEHESVGLRKKLLVKNARESLTLIRPILEEIICLIQEVEGPLRYDVLPVISQNQRDLLFKAQVEENAEVSYIAGRICLSQRDEYAVDENGHYVAGRLSEPRCKYLHKLAIAHLEYAADEIKDACFWLAKQLSLGWGGKSRIDEGIELMLKTARAGNLSACVFAGDSLMLGMMWPIQDLKIAKELLEYAANRDDAEANRLLFLYHTISHKEDQDVQEGLDYLSRAVELGSADAECELYRLYHNGRWVDKDEELARQWLDQAAAHGSRQAIMMKQLEEFHGGIERKLRVQHVMTRTAQPTRLPPGFDSQEGRKALSPLSLNTKKIGRNDPCMCGSGKKHKKCCGRS
jgi:hypothetical protein